LNRRDGGPGEQFGKRRRGVRDEVQRHL
jgi:hypothetical protein